MKKKKGFTLVELIAVIALLAVIITIAGISVVSIKENTLKNERTNLRTTIKIAAKEYHEETGIDLVPVLVLLQTGRIEADEIAKSSAGVVQKGDPVIYDPVTGDVINCECVSFKDSSDGKWDSTTDCCSPNIIAANIGIEYKYPKSTSAEVEYPQEADVDWFAMGNGETLILKGSIDDDNITYTWINPSAPDVAINGAEYKVEIPEIGYINGQYVLTANIEGHYAEKTFTLMVDGKLPYMENFYIEGIESWSATKMLHADFKDYESGLYGYYINRSASGCSKDISKYKKKATIDGVETQIEGNNEFALNESITENGDLSICLRDSAGNVIESDNKITVSRVDGTKPEMTLTVVNGTEYKKSNSVKVELYDPGEAGSVSGLPNASYNVKYVWSKTAISNCSSVSNSNILTLTDPDGDGRFTGSVTISSGTGKGKIYVCPSGTITDLAGNELENNPKSTNMYLDNTAPTCGTKTNSSTTWTKTNKTVSVACGDKSGEDNQSGCVKTSYSKDYSSNTKTDTIQIADKAGNTTNCSVDVYLDKTAPTCGTKTNSTTSWSNSNKGVSVACSDSFGECEKSTYTTSYTTTTKTSSITISDKAGNTASCPVDVYLDKDAPVCGTVSGQSTSWTNSNRTISVACSDNNSTNSGCVSSSVSNTFTSTAQTGTIQISDKAGNTKNCSVNVYIDKTAPTIGSLTVSSTNSSYNGPTVNAKLNSLADSHSGVSAVCLTTSNNSSGCSWVSNTSSSYTYSNQSTGLSTGSGSQKTYYAFVKDAAGNVSSSASRTYTLYEYCDETTSSTGSWSSCSVSCGGGTRSRTTTYKDKYFTSQSCGSNTEYDSCNTQSCCDSSYSDSINGYRYYGCDQIYVYSCQPTCNTWAQCDTNAGYVYRDDLRSGEPSGCVDLCDYTDDSSPLFGSYKGHLSGNYGTWYGSLGFSYTCYNAGTCSRSNGYDRICVTDLCGAYYGYTAKQLSNALGCHFSTYWCSCSHSGSF